MPEILLITEVAFAFNNPVKLHNVVHSECLLKRSLNNSVTFSCGNDVKLWVTVNAIVESRVFAIRCCAVIY